jgi:AcrR family transcriptional regulator
MTTPPRVPKRDPEKTRARILKTAVAEFAARGFSGARTARIARTAKVNVRMLYHYFGGKDALYIAVLEAVFENLRREELQLDFEDTEPLAGLLQLFDFIDGHFARHPELRALFAYENLNRAQHLRRSARIPTMSSPVIGLVERLLIRGQRAGQFRPGIDALRLYVTMVSLSYYSKAHAHTLSRIFEVDLAAPTWQRAQADDVHRLLAAFVVAPAR